MGGFADQPGFADDVRSVLGDLLGLPQELLDYINQYIALNPLPIPLSQVTGYQNYVASVAAAPSGTLVPYAGASAPGGWLFADGSAQSRTTYATLFGVIGTTYGAGDGSTTFNLPDVRGRVPVGKGTNGDVSALAASDGLSVANRSPKHNSSDNIDFSANIYQNGGGGPGIAGSNGLTFISAIDLGAGTYGAKSGSVGPGGSRPTDTPAFVVVNYLIKT